MVNLEKWREPPGKGKKSLTTVGLPRKYTVKEKREHACASPRAKDPGVIGFKNGLSADINHAACLRLETADKKKKREEKRWEEAGRSSSRVIKRNRTMEEKNVSTRGESH